MAETRTDRTGLLQSVRATESIEFLAEMIRFKSYSGTPGEGELARFMVDRMRALGLEAFVQEVEPGRMNAIGRWRGTGGGKSLMFNGHLDTNPVTEGWTVDPFGGVHDDEFIYGIGVSNMKAGDAAAFRAVGTLIEQGVRLRGDVVLAFVIGELQGGIGTIKAIDEGIRADYFINSEPTDLAGLTLHSGAFNWIVELQGITRHSSKREDAVDALGAAAALVPRLNALAFSGAASADHAAVNRCHVGVMRAGLSRELHEWRPPQVADFARLVGTGRYAPSQSIASVLGDIRRLLDTLEREHPGLKTTVSAAADTTGRPDMLPFEVPRTARIVDVVSRAYRTVRGSDQPLGPTAPYCFYGTDAAHLQHRAHMEGIVCGPGGRYNTMPDERVDVPDYLDMIRMYVLAMLDICEQGGR
jgi:acetylornithine deacetylase